MGKLFDREIVWKPMGCIPSKGFLRAGLIALTLIGLGIEPSDATLPELLLSQGTLLPEEADGPFQHWSRRKKYFLVIAVNQTDVPKTELPFAKVDGQRVVKTLTSLGYKPLDPDHSLLTGKEATASAIMASLDEARKKEEEATLVIYYTGHGAVGPKDLWLQTAGQKKVGDGQGLKVSDLVVQVRQTAAGKGFEGELVLILDACYSGQGIVSQGLTMGELGKHTTIFTSSSDIQESFSLNHPNLPKMSAFTHTLLQGAGSDWAMADGDGDGILRWEELATYAESQLQALKKSGAIAHPMEPWMVTNYRKGLLAYRRDQVRVWKSPYRTSLTTDEVNTKLAAHLQQLEGSPRDKPALPKEAQVLAKNLEPAPDDYYAQAVKATTEGQWETARTLFTKADTQAKAIKQRETEKQGQIAWDRARMERYAGRFTESFAQYQHAATLAPPTTAALLNEIGVAGILAGQYLQAERYLTQGLQQREQSLSASHPDVAESLNTLAWLYDVQTRYAEAEPLYQRALQIRKAASGMTHPHVATILNNLASHYSGQGRYAQAEPLYQRALQIREAALGATHPDVARILNNLALLYYHQGRYAQAEPLYQHALQIREAALGATHPDVGESLNNLAELYRGQGRYAQAEPLYQRALQIDESALGAQHPFVATDLNNLALLYKAQGRYAEVEPLYQRVLQIREAALGATHPDVGQSLNNLASLYKAQGRYAQAEPLYQRSYWIVFTKLGPDHPSVKFVWSNYKACLRDSGQPASEDNVMQKLRASSYAPRNAISTP
ncbi:MAG: tetratricopeptide repeat protein [Nitrospira sp.]|nr:tetratricopeptide repeat protein [Nitrospira sp.]